MSSESLGHVDIRSGTLTVVDFGFIGAWSGSNGAAQAAMQAVAAQRYSFEHEGVPAVVVPHLPRGRFPVSSVRILQGPFANLRQAVMIDFVPNPQAARTIELGKVCVDNARIGLFDVDALGAWNEEAPVDGLADVVFWGLHQNEVAAQFRAPSLGEDGFGFKDLPVAQAMPLAQQLDQLRNTGQYRFAFDYRPHTHPYYLLAQLRENPTEAGVLDVGGMLACGFMTTWGDGEYPVLLDLDAQNRPIRCGIFLATQESMANVQAVNN